jgi:hypothetical protein
MKQISEKQLEKQANREFDRLEVKFYYWWFSSLSGFDPMDPAFDEWMYENWAIIEKLQDAYWMAFETWLYGGPVTLRRL